MIGLAGGQGTGKTTISSILSLILTKFFKLNVFKVSIDDFYKTRKDRKFLSKRKHPLLITRGVPGTHDIDLMLNFFKKLNLKVLKIYKFLNLIKQLMIVVQETYGISLNQSQT